MNITKCQHFIEHLNISLKFVQVTASRQRFPLFPEHCNRSSSHQDARLKYGESWRNSGYLCEFQPIYVLRNPIKSNPMLEAGNGNRQFLCHVKSHPVSNIVKPPPVRRFKTTLYILKAMLFGSSDLL